MGCVLRIFHAICLITALLCGPVMGQQTGTSNAQPQASAPESQAPVVLTLRDALERARNLDPTYRTALTAAGIAREDHVQARAALLPSVTYNNQFVYTQGNGT